MQSLGSVSSPPWWGGSLSSEWKDERSVGSHNDRSQEIVVPAS